MTSTTESLTDRMAQIESLLAALVDTSAPSAPSAPSRENVQSYSNNWRDHIAQPKPKPKAKRKTVRPQPQEQQVAPDPVGITRRKKPKAEAKAEAKAKSEAVNTVMRLRWVGKGIVGVKKLGRAEGNPSQYKEYALERVNAQTGEVITRQMFGSQMVLDITDFAGVECPPRS